MDEYRIATDRFYLRLIYFLFSLFGAALGITFIFKAHVGVDPANFRRIKLPGLNLRYQK